MGSEGSEKGVVRTVGLGSPYSSVEGGGGGGEGLGYVAGNGGFMRNKGELAIRVSAAEGRRCLLNMQVTDVKNYAGVARIRDAGHVATFRPDGGSIVDLDVGQETKFQWVGNMHRPRASVWAALTGLGSKCFTLRLQLPYVGCAEVWLP